MLEKRLMFWELKTDHVSKIKLSTSKFVYSVRLAGRRGAFTVSMLVRLDWIGLGSPLRR